MHFAVFRAWQEKCEQKALLSVCYFDIHKKIIKLRVKIL